MVNHTDVPGWSRHTAGVIAELDRLGAYRGRVEVVPTGSHREARVFAQYFQGGARLEPPTRHGTRPACSTPTSWTRPATGRG
ncbi:hypothetical protein ACU686_14965 [Yinghuangia aomiensis]